MNNIEVTLLSKEEILSNSRVLKKVGKECNYLYWTRTSLNYGHLWHIALEFMIIDPNGNLYFQHFSNVYGIRPVLKFDNLEKLIKSLKIEFENDIKIVEYGQYPDLKVQFNIPNNASLKPTGKKYYYPLNKLDIYSLYECFEYKYNKEKIVNIEDKYYKVKPVKFYVDEENNMLISKDILFASAINLDNPNYNGIFNTTQLYQFLNNQFIKNLTFANEKDIIDAEIQKIEEKIKENNLENEKLKQLIQEKKELIAKLQLEYENLDIKRENSNSSKNNIGQQKTYHL